MQLSKTNISTDLLFKSCKRTDNAFEQEYIRTRLKENRIYRDEELIRLPEINADHPHYPEWRQRKIAAKRLFAYLQKKQKSLTILEIGCGNGWLSHYLSNIPASFVTGQDINKTELKQASKVFAEKKNLTFIHGDIFDGILGGHHYDVIVLAAAIQYFPTLAMIISWSLDHLTETGELHIMDSPFYSKKDVPAARNRTREYYNRIGRPEMSSYYFHHAWEDLCAFPVQIKHDPRSSIHWLLKNKQAFPWVCLNKK